MRELITALKVGDVVRNPEDHGARLMVILSITDGYFVLTPFTSHGWPSKDRRKWQYYKLEDLDKLKPTTKKDGYPRLLACPDCITDGKMLFQAPLRKLSVYEERYQCQTCKQVWIKTNIGMKGERQ